MKVILNILVLGSDHRERILFSNIFGNPRRIIVDKGTAFSGKDFKNFGQEDDIELWFSTTGVHRFNGQMHRIVSSSLAKLTIDKPERWFIHID